jgi:beta-galactosidase
MKKSTLSVINAFLFLKNFISSSQQEISKEGKNYPDSNFLILQKSKDWGGFTFDLITDLGFHIQFCLPKNQRKNVILFFLFSFSVSTNLSAQDFLAFRKPENLVKWNFAKADYTALTRNTIKEEKYQQITIPHTWNDKDVITEGTTMYHGVATYECEIGLENKPADERYFLRFEGVCQQAELYINMKYVGVHKGSYSAFCFDVTPYLEKGKKNAVLVRVNNIPSRDIVPSSEDLYPLFGGIYRPVTFFKTKTSCISPLDFGSTGVYIQQHTSNTVSNIDVNTMLSCQTNEQKKYTVQVSFLDQNNKTVASANKSIEIASNTETAIKQTVKINNPHLWNGKLDPFEYKCQVKLLENGVEIDKVEQNIGLRYYEIDPKKGFILNGKEYPLHGVTRHQEIENFGSALSAKQHQTDFDLINEIGANSLRLAHYQQADLMYDLSSKNGILVWAEIPNTPPYIIGNPLYMENCKQQLRELIKQNFNKTSIFVWGMGNEITIPVEDMRELHKTAKETDSLRPTVYADNQTERELNTVTDAAAWNMYYGWYGGELDQYSKRVDQIQTKFPDMKVGISEYGAGGCISQQAEEYPKPNPFDGKFYPEQYQTYYHEKVWNNIKDRNDIWCKFIWNMFDFSWTTVKRGDMDFKNDKGLITHDRKVKKDAFYFYKANWSTEPVLRIADSRLINRKKEITSIKVYSNLKNVTLVFNGVKINTQRTPSDLHIIEWGNIQLKKGENTIEVSGYKGKEKFTDQCEWNYE